MDNIRSYINTLKEVLESLFERTEQTCNECRKLTESLNSSFSSELREKNIQLMTLFQFGDIICQSFESFEVVLDELLILENSQGKLEYSEAERFSRLIGAVANSTFSLIGRTMTGINENLAATKEIFCKMKDVSGVENSISRCIESIDYNIAQLESSARQTVLSTEELGLFCVEKISSMDFGDENKALSGRLYEKFRVREHIEILKVLFPSNRDHSETGSLELF